MTVKPEKKSLELLFVDLLKCVIYIYCIFFGPVVVVGLEISSRSLRADFKQSFINKGYLKPRLYFADKHWNLTLGQ